MTMIKKKTYFILAAAFSAITACSDFHTSDNGKLDGRWQLTQADTLANGHSADLRPNKIFWSVQSRLLKMEELHALQGNYPGIFFHFDMKDNQLHVYNPVADNREISDSLITSVETVRFYGLEHLDETFKILQLESGRMTLENGFLRMYFRKY